MEESLESAVVNKYDCDEYISHLMKYDLLEDAYKLAGNGALVVILHDFIEFAKCDGLFTSQIPSELRQRPLITYGDTRPKTT